MAVEGIVFGLWFVALVLVVWQAVLTVQLQRLRTSERSRGAGRDDLVGLGLFYNGLIEELGSTADEKIALLEERIAELEALLDRHAAQTGGRRVRHVSFTQGRLRRCG